MLRSNILDYGCGLGVFFLQLEKKKNNLYGTDLDITPAAKLLHGHDWNDVHLFQVDELDEVIPDSSLEVVLSLEVLEHVENLPAIINQLKRKLSPEGRLIISGPTENLFYGVLREITGFTGEYHHRDINDIVQCICEEGFSIIKRRNIPLFRPFDAFAVYEFEFSE